MALTEYDLSRNSYVNLEQQIAAQLGVTFKHTRLPKGEEVEVIIPGSGDALMYTNHTNRRLRLVFNPEGKDRLIVTSADSHPPSVPLWKRIQGLSDLYLLLQLKAIYEEISQDSKLQERPYFHDSTQAEDWLLRPFSHLPANSRVNSLSTEITFLQRQDELDHTDKVQELLVYISQEVAANPRLLGVYHMAINYVSSKDARYPSDQEWHYLMLLINGQFIKARSSQGNPMFAQEKTTRLLARLIKRKRTKDDDRGEFAALTKYWQTVENLMKATGGYTNSK